MKKKLINPIIPGFYPDPSICRVGGDYYLACSSFELCPGVPIFHSRDLAHWEQICYAMTPENGFHMERDSGVGGVMAPTLRYHDGLFYIINANFSDKGNYIVTAEDPAGPWSEPHWLDDVPGIDASLFFDDAPTKTYITMRQKMSSICFKHNCFYEDFIFEDIIGSWISWLSLKKWGI